MVSSLHTSQLMTVILCATCRMLQQEEGSLTCHFVGRANCSASVNDEKVE